MASTRQALTARRDLVSSAAEDTLLQVFESLLPHLSLCGLARLAAVNTKLAGGVEQTLRKSRPYHQLVQVFEEVSAELKAFLEPRTAPLPRLWEVVKFLRGSRPWGPAMANAPGLTQDLATIFTISLHRFPIRMAVSLVENTQLRITHAQLMRAARNRVAGVETWVQAQSELDIHTDLSPNVVAICCCPLESYSGPLILDLNGVMAPAATADLLQIALNCDGNKAADQTTAQLLPLLANLDQLGWMQLLLTAMMRQHHEAIMSILAQDTLAIQQLTAQQIVQLLQVLIQANAERIERHCTRPRFQESAMLAWLKQQALDEARRLMQLQQATSMSTADLTQLIQAALARGLEHIAVALCNPVLNIHQVDAPSILRLLELAVRNQQNDALATLIRMPATAELDTEAVSQLIAAACQAVKFSIDRHRQVDTLQTAADIKLALLRRTSALELLCGIPAAAQLSAAFTYHTAQAAITTGCGNFMVVCSLLDSIKDVSVDVLTALMEAHQQYDRNDEATLKQLLQLPAAKELPGRVITGLLQTTIQQHNIDQLKDVSGCAAIINLDAGNVLTLLQTAMELDYVESGIITTLCEFEAVAELSGADMDGLLRSAIERRHSSSVSIMCKLKAARLLGSTEVSGLLQAAVEVGNKSMITALQRLCCAEAGSSFSKPCSVAG